eukprot:SAG11_NODE_1844_length_4178_cov_4.716842_3_plen_253_part_00
MYADSTDLSSILDGSAPGGADPVAEVVSEGGNGSDAAASAAAAAAAAAAASAASASAAASTSDDGAGPAAPAAAEVAAGDAAAAQAAAAEVEAKAEKDKWSCMPIKFYFEPNRTGFEATTEYEAVPDALIIGRYRILKFLGEGAFSKAIQCFDTQEKCTVCIKIVKCGDRKDYFDQSLDEIKLLQYINAGGDMDANHIFSLFDFFYHKEHLFIGKQARINDSQFARTHTQTHPHALYTRDARQIFNSPGTND